MCVGNLNDPGRVYPECLRNHGKLIREGDVDISIGVLYDLDKLRRHVIGEEDLALDERFVD